ncbi:hypothetical protein GGI42DRAFT_312335 [Trichoderma sp. SZMC 28013]
MHTLGSRGARSEDRQFLSFVSFSLSLSLSLSFSLKSMLSFYWLISQLFSISAYIFFSSISVTCPVGSTSFIWRSRGLKDP